MTRHRAGESDVVIGENRHDAGRRFGGRGIDTPQLRMRMRAPQKRCESLVFEAQIVGVLAMAGDKAKVLGPAD